MDRDSGSRDSVNENGVGGCWGVGERKRPRKGIQNRDRE